MENHFKMPFYRMFRSSIVSCKFKKTIEDFEDPAFIPKTTHSRQFYQLIEQFSSHPRPFPFMCRPKWPKIISEEPHASPISPLNANYEVQKFHSESKKTGKTINKKVHSKTKMCKFRDKEEFTTEKCGISNGFETGARSRRAQKKNPKEGLIMPLQEGVRDSIAVVKRSSDPYTDFRTSVVEMIVEKQIFTAKELEKLLQCYLSLNSYHHHRIIIEVFSNIWEVLFVS